MQRCLAVEELVRTIVHCAAEEQNWASLLRVALVSHIFYEPTMDEMWRTLPGISPLILCLPAAKISTAGTPKKAIITCSLLEEEWARFEHHARRVEALVLHGSDWLPMEAAELASLDIIRNYYLGPVLPRLRSLTVDSIQHLPRHVEMFMGQSLVGFDLRASQPPPVLIALLDSCRSRSPHVSHIGFAHPRQDVHGDMEWHSAFTRAVCAFEHLKSIGGTYWSYHTLPAEVIVHLSHSPTYENLSLTIKESNVAICRSTSLGSFASLTVLRLHLAEATIPSDWKHLFQSLRCAGLQDLSLSIVYQPPADEPTASSELIPWLETLGRFHDLRSCWLMFESVDRPSGIWSDCLDPSILRPLYHAPGMRQLSLSRLPIKLTSPACQELAGAWPHLSALSLRCALDVPPVDRLPLEDLAHLACRCPQLEHVEVSVAPITADWAWQELGHDIPPSKMRRLSFCTDFHLALPAHTAPKVAAFFDTYFPRVGVQYEWGNIDAVLDGEDRQQRREAFALVLQSRSKPWESEEDELI